MMEEGTSPRPGPKEGPPIPKQKKKSPDDEKPRKKMRKGKKRKERGLLSRTGPLILKKEKKRTFLSRFGKKNTGRG